MQRCVQEVWWAGDWVLALGEGGFVSKMVRLGLSDGTAATRGRGRAKPRQTDGHVQIHCVHARLSCLLS